MMIDEKADMMFDGLFDHIEDLLDFSNEDDFVVDGNAFNSSSSSSTSNSIIPCHNQRDFATSAVGQIPMLSAHPLLHSPSVVRQDDETYQYDVTPLSCCTGSIPSAAAVQTITTTSTPPIAQPLQEDHIDPLDIKQLEWLSDFFEDSFTPSACIDLTHSSSFVNDGKTAGHANHNGSRKGGGENGGEEEESQVFRTSSPVSVLGPTNIEDALLTSYYSSTSSSSSSTLFVPPSASPTSSACSEVGAFSSITISNSGGSGGGAVVKMHAPPEILVVPGRARTKRPRPANFKPRSYLLTPLLPPPTTTIPEAENGPVLVHGPPSQSESFAESYPLPSESGGVRKKKKNKKQSHAAPADNEAPGGGVAVATAAAAAVRKCMHCEIQKTPQWRAGPMGPKTLCNACGVRYKSGRLFPEYRPAASPTFVPTLHSNSHKKVVEMRNQLATADVAPQAQDVVATKACLLLDYIRRGV